MVHDDLTAAKRCDITVYRWLLGYHFTRRDCIVSSYRLAMIVLTEQRTGRFISPLSFSFAIHAGLLSMGCVAI
jgi:hypothetical protein